MNHPELFERIHQAAEKAGFQIYAVGGYVRDTLLGKSGKDIDFVIIGDAMVFADVLKRTLHLRRILRYPKFGTFMTHYYGYQLEFVQARTETYESSSRKPRIEQSDLLSDLKRRDFTINAMAMDISGHSFGRLIDLHNGQKHLQQKIITTPLDPQSTFADDPLRMMRAVRFAAQLNFTIETNTFSAIVKQSKRISIVSAERIRDEFNRMLMCRKPSAGLKLLDESGLLKQILPEFSQMKGVEQRRQFQHKDVFNHTLEVVDNVAGHKGSLNLRLAALFHDIGKPRTKRFDEETGWTFHGHEVVGERMTGAILKRMCYSGEQIAYVKKLVSLHLRPMALVSEEVTDSAVRRLIFNAGDDIDDLMRLCQADITSKNERKVQRYLGNYERVLHKISEVEEKDRLRNFQPPVDGNEIMQMFGLNPGPQVGRIKRFIEEAILNGDVTNDHEACVQFIQQHRRQLLEEMQ